MDAQGSMSVPKCIFIDTTAFDETGYNFASARIQAFRKAIEGLNLTFLDPDPMNRERRRHIDKKAKELIDELEQTNKILEKVKSRMPALASLRNLPKKVHFDLYHARHLIGKSLTEFLEPMKVVKLGYEGIKIETVMDWYDQANAPFGTGKKAKEFPDALAIAILDRYAKSKGTEVAVISNDADMKRACEARPHLLYFSSLAAYLEISQGHEELIQGIKQRLDETPDFFESSLRAALEDVQFEIEFEDSEIGYADYDAINLDNIHVVTVSDSQCTVSFDVEVSYSVSISFTDPNDTFMDARGDVYLIGEKKGYAWGTFQTSGIAKLRLDEKRALDGEVTLLELDERTVNIDRWDIQLF